MWKTDPQTQARFTPISCYTAALFRRDIMGRENAAKLADRMKSMSLYLCAAVYSVYRCGLHLKTCGAESCSGYFHQRPRNSSRFFIASSVNEPIKRTSLRICSPVE